MQISKYMYKSLKYKIMEGKQMNEMYATMKDYESVELQEALLDLEIAENQFNHCDPEFIDYCILQIESARLKLSAIYKNLKLEGDNEQVTSVSDCNWIVRTINRIFR